MNAFFSPLKINEIFLPKGKTFTQRLYLAAQVKRSEL